MMKKHMCVDIKWLMGKSDEYLADMMKVDGAKVSGHVIRDQLADRLIDGERVLPLGECEGFDPVLGCPGHK